MDEYGTYTEFLERIGWNKWRRENCPSLKS